MAVNAYVLLTVDPAKTQAVAERLRNIPRAIVHEVLGPYDIIVELEGGTQEDITGLLRNKIRNVSGVTSTVTCLCMEGRAGSG
ncbi:MAG: Lrp/AsnC ligand binding domain-containing protein [Chloroflexi bacterium]|nr:Lrp/AsnC ligand binding domain-containing protein [Chloroflexota bacterium]